MQMLNLRLWLLVLGALLLVAWFVYSWLQPVKAPAGAPSQGPIAVEALPATRGDVLETLSLPGEVEALRGVTLRAEVNGKVTRLIVAEGELVQRGQVLLELDARAARAETIRTRAEATLASTTLQRLRQAQAASAASPLELDEAVAREALARGAFQAALAAEDKLIIRAPFAGRSGLQQVVLGETVTAGQALVSIADDRALRVRFRVPERALAQVKAGQALTIQHAGQVLQTSLSTLDSLIEPSTRSRLAQVLITPEQAATVGLQAGQFTQVLLPVKLAEDAVQVPAMAILPGLEGPRLMVISATNPKLGQVAIATATPIKILARSSETVAVTGITAGQFVVIAGQQKLRGANPQVRLVTPTAIPFIGTQPETMP